MSQSNQIFPHPFSKAYWKTAAQEFKNTRMLIFAALMIALRVIFKPISIPIGMDLRINTAFLINAFGAMIYGPVVAIAAAAITDTLGCILFPTGPYFFPFIFQEIAGSLIFSLFLYRADLSTRRVVLSRFCIDFFVNIVLTTPIMMLYYEVMLGRYYAPFDLLRIIKNLVLFPFESIVLILFLNLTIPRVRSLGFVIGSTEKLKLNKKVIPFILILFLIGCIAVGGYCWYAYEHTSLSAQYTQEERFAHNVEMTDVVRAHEKELEDETLITVVEAAYPKLFSKQVTYTVGVYSLDEEVMDQNILAEHAEVTEDLRASSLKTMQGYSKTPASKDTALVRIGTATFVLDADQQCLDYRYTPSSGT